MKLKKVAQYFNNTKFYDAYSGLELGVGQLDVFDDSKRDGLTALRRIFEVAPGTQMPPRLAINFHGINWLVGVTEIDAFKGSTVREKHVLHQAEELAQVRTVRETLMGSQPLEAFAARVWVRAAAEVEISSTKLNQLQLFFSRAEPIKPDQLVLLGGKLHTIMTVYPAAAGHLVAVSEELEDGAIEEGTIPTTGKWDPITETYIGGGTETVKLVKLRWQSDFSYYSEATPDFERGDMQCACLTRPANGTEITLDDGTWTVISSQARNDVFYLHMRRA